MLKEYKITNECIDSNVSNSPRTATNIYDYSNFPSPQNSYASSKTYSAPASVDSQYNSEIIGTPNSQYPMSITQDAIIDEILDAQDMKLLETVFNSTNEPVRNSVQIKERSVLDPKDFLNIVVTKDFEVNTKEKVQWLQDIDNFNSLLDDMLKEYKPTEVNTIDCY